MKKGIPRTLAVLSAMFAGALALAGAVTAAVKPQTSSQRPINEARLVNALKVNGLSEADLVALIESRGVDFEVTDHVAADIKKAGGSAAIIAACKANYRSAGQSRSARGSDTEPGDTKPSDTKPGDKKSSETKSREPADAESAEPSPDPTPEGPVNRVSPFELEEVLGLLKGGVPSAKVEEMVTDRGAAFTLDPKTGAAIREAGGEATLLLAITEHWQKRTKPGSDSSSRGKPASGSKAGAGPDRSGSESAAEKRSQAIKINAIPPDSRIEGVWRATGIAQNPLDPRQTVEITFTITLSVEMIEEDYGKLTGELKDESGSHPIREGEWRYGRQASFIFTADHSDHSFAATLDGYKLAGIVGVKVGDAFWQGRFEARKQE
ncbi:MAG TPA: hypothetical protein VEZ90_12485 [Blastocatellia bacterium]|nr:hypothetical protein [Blastocatellia bacterium]